MSAERIDRIVLALKQGTFRWKPVRRVSSTKQMVRNVRSASLL